MSKVRITDEEWKSGVRECGNCGGCGFYGTWNGTDYDRTGCIDCNETGRVNEARRSPAQGWRPISEAPMDGRRVLCGRMNINPYVGRWCDKNKEWLEAASGYAVGRDPTHFMPLPPPPTEGDDE